MLEKLGVVSFRTARKRLHVSAMVPQARRQLHLSCLGMHRCDPWRKHVLQVLIGLFTSYRDGDDKLQALQALGLNPGNGHLYQESKREPVSR